MNRIRPEEMISVRNRRYPSGIDRIRCLKPLTFVIDVMNVDGGDERLTAHPDAPIQNGSSSFRWQNETRSNLPNLADTWDLRSPSIARSFFLSFYNCQGKTCQPEQENPATGLAKYLAVEY